MAPTEFPVRVALLAFLALAPACERGDTSLPDECESDDDCDESAPHCFNGSCVECAGGEDCGCHEACSENRCVPLGADAQELADHAHGTWSGTPGTGGYVFTGTCAGDGECDAPGMWCLAQLMAGGEHYVLRAEQLAHEPEMVRVRAELLGAKLS